MKFTKFVGLITIGKNYKRKILCFVDDFDDCDILLGKPWVQEVKGMHDFQKKSLSFFMGRKKDCYRSTQSQIKITKVRRYDERKGFE